MSTVTRCLILLILVLAVGLLPLAPVQPALSQATPSLGFIPDRLSLDAGATGVVDLQAQGVSDLASFEVDLTFDPTIVAVERVERMIGTAVQPSPNRIWTSLPTGSGTGYLQLGPGRITFGGFSYGGDNPPGVTGDVTLTRLTVRGVRPGQSSLTLTRALLTDTQAQPTTPTVGAGVVVISGGGSNYSLFLPYLAAAEPSRLP